jgi:hypothetical protein
MTFLNFSPTFVGYSALLAGPTDLTESGSETLDKIAQMNPPFDLLSKSLVRVPCLLDETEFLVRFIIAGQKRVLNTKSRYGTGTGGFLLCYYFFKSRHILRVDKIAQINLLFDLNL